MPDPITGSFPAAGTAIQAGAAPVPPSPTSDKDMFMKLLVAQLKFQNPMSPTDPSAFLTQSAQFTVIEKLEEIAATNAALLSSDRTLSATNMVGRTVSYLGADGTEAVGVVSGVTLDPAGPVLHVGDTEVALTAVRGVRQATAL